MFTKKSTRREFEINKKQLLDESILLPSLPEQTKIATFLTSIDERIEALTEQLELTRDYKKGMMQRIFSQELRFKDDEGNEYPEWVEKKLGEVFKFKQGVQCDVEKQSFNKNKNNIRFIRIVDITSENEPFRYINDPGKEHHVSENDLFMIRYGVAGVVAFGYSGVIANNLFRFLPINSNEVYNKFYFFLFSYMKKYFEKLAVSSTMPALNFTSLNSIVVYYPCLEEQTKIATFLSSIDNRIEALSEQLEQTKLFKKAMLQRVLV